MRTRVVTIRGDSPPDPPLQLLPGILWSVGCPVCVWRVSFVNGGLESVGV